MEPIFENVTVPTQEQLTIFRWAVRGKACIKIVLIYAGLVALLFLLKLTEPVFDKSFILYPVLLGLLSLWQLTAPTRDARDAYLRTLSYYDNTLPPATIRFYENHFEIRDVDSVLIVPYRKLTAAKYHKGILVLIRKDGTAHYLDTNAFTKGDYDSFTHFLREKASHLEAITGK